MDRSFIIFNFFNLLKMNSDAINYMLWIDAIKKHQLEDIKKYFNVDNDDNIKRGLYKAAKYHPDLIKYILSLDTKNICTNIFSVSNRGCIILNKISKFSVEEIIKAILYVIERIDQKDKKIALRFALEKAIRYNNRIIAAFLVTQGADIYVDDSYLFKLTKNRNIIGWLLHKNAFPCSNKDNNAFTFACKTNRKDLAIHLLKIFPNFINSIDIALEIAYEYRILDMIPWLLELGAEKPSSIMDSDFNKTMEKTYIPSNSINNNTIEKTHSAPAYIYHQYLRNAKKKLFVDDDKYSCAIKAAYYDGQFDIVIKIAKESNYECFQYLGTTILKQILGQVFNLNDSEIYLFLGAICKDQFIMLSAIYNGARVDILDDYIFYKVCKDDFYNLAKTIRIYNSQYYFKIHEGHIIDYGKK